MIPLKQFICDTCGGVIEKIEDGWFEWLSENDPKGLRYKNFRICHHEEKCMLLANDPDVCDGHLEDYLNEDGHLHLLSMLHPGDYASDKYDGPRVLEMGEFMEIYRRLTIPLYEDARQYFAQAKNDGFLDSTNDVTLYRERMLTSIIENYSKKEEFINVKAE